jgi:hypothetical protein
VWKFVNVGFWIASLVVATCFSLALGLNLVLAPAAIVVGWSVGTSARRLNDWTCPHCNEELVEPDPYEDMLPAPQWRRVVKLTPAKATGT